eukprot:jgi/Picsp_1/852/NSC_04340-R1_---NA---
MSEHDKNRDKKVVKRILAILCNSQQLSEPEKDGRIDPESPQNVPQKMELQKGNEEYFEMLRAELDKLVRTLSKEDKMDLLQELAAKESLAKHTEEMEALLFDPRD